MYYCIFVAKVTYGTPRLIKSYQYTFKKLRFNTGLLKKWQAKLLVCQLLNDKSRQDKRYKENKETREKLRGFHPSIFN